MCDNRPSETIFPVTPILQMLLSRCTIELAHLLKLAHASSRFMDHWQFWISNDPALRLVQLFSLASYFRWLHPGITRLRFLYLSNGILNSMSVKIASESIHLIHSASGWANIAARRTGFLDQAPLLVDGIKRCCKRCHSHGFCNSILCSWTSLASSDLQYNFYTLWAGTLLP